MWKLSAEKYFPSKIKDSSLAADNYYSREKHLNSLGKINLSSKSLHVS
jgi:hypothetical protein